MEFPEHTTFGGLLLVLDILMREGLGRAIKLLWAIFLEHATAQHKERWPSKLRRDRFDSERSKISTTKTNNLRLGGLEISGPRREPPMSQEALQDPPPKPSKDLRKGRPVIDPKIKLEMTPGRTQNGAQNAQRLVRRRHTNRKEFWLTLRWESRHKMDQGPRNPWLEAQG